MTSKGFADLSVARDHLRLCVVRLSRLGETDVLTNLRRELARLEAEIRRVDALRAPARPLEDLLDEVDALADRLRHIIEKQT